MLCMCSHSFFSHTRIHTHTFHVSMSERWLLSKRTTVAHLVKVRFERGDQVALTCCIGWPSEPVMNTLANTIVMMYAFGWLTCLSSYSFSLFSLFLFFANQSALWPRSPTISVLTQLSAITFQQTDRQTDRHAPRYLQCELGSVLESAASRSVCRQITNSYEVSGWVNQGLPPWLCCQPPVVTILSMMKHVRWQWLHTMHSDFHSFGAYCCLFTHLTSPSRRVMLRGHHDTPINDKSIS